MNIWHEQKILPHTLIHHPELEHHRNGTTSNRYRTRGRKLGVIRQIQSQGHDQRPTH